VQRECPPTWVSPRIQKQPGLVDVAPDGGRNAPKMWHGGSVRTSGFGASGPEPTGRPRVEEVRPAAATRLPVDARGTATHRPAFGDDSDFPPAAFARIPPNPHQHASPIPGTPISWRCRDGGRSLLRLPSPSSTRYTKGKRAVYAVEGCIESTTRQLKEPGGDRGARWGGLGVSPAACLWWPSDNLAMLITLQRLLAKWLQHGRRTGPLGSASVRVS
jgi:hypothetical protein